MTKNKIYLEPEVRVVELCLEGAVLSGSDPTSASATGEEISWGTEFNPW
jgi:hypothetical protein